MSSKELLAKIREILESKWTTRDGRSISEFDDVKTGNDGIKMSGTAFCADISGSSELVTGYKSWFAAEIYKAFTISAERVVDRNNGSVISCDGDRVIAIFYGTTRNSSAVRAALQLNYVVREINKALKEVYPKTAYALKHAVGVDSGEILVSRSGAKNGEQFLWIGTPVNMAARLSREGESDYATYITESVYQKLADASKLGGDPSRDMWERRTWVKTKKIVYRSNWWWQF
jgi:class 3 adenylate cyclase